MALLPLPSLRLIVRAVFRVFVSRFAEQAMLAGAAFLQGFLNFCAGCFVLEYLIKWGLVSKGLYRMHIKTRYVRASWYVTTLP